MPWCTGYYRLIKYLHILIETNFVLNYVSHDFNLCQTQD